MAIAMLGYGETNNFCRRLPFFEKVRIRGGRRRECV